MVLSRKTQLVVPTKGATVSISEKEDGPYEVISDAKNKVKLNHFKKGYFIKQEKEGHVSHTYELTRTATNRVKRLDISMLVVADIFATIFTPLHFIVNRSSNTPVAVRTFQSIALFSTLAYGTLGWAAVIPAPKNIYPKKVELPSLIEILTKDSNQLSLTAGPHEFKLPNKGLRVHDFPSMKQYKNGYGYESRDTADNFAFIEKLDLYDDIADILVRSEYGVDSLTATNTTALKVKSWTRSVVFMTADDKLRCELRTTWALQTLDGLQYLYDKSFNANSEWEDFKESDLETEAAQKVIKSQFLVALDESFKKFVAMDTVQAILSAPVPIPLEDEVELSLNTGSTFVKSVSETVKSVITVVTKRGHGSGCVISPDGYILTNAHVVEDDTTGLQAIMSNDSKRKIPIKFVRMNEAVDLALLKLDTSGLTPIKLATAEQIEVGSDVYAIGTPADTDLGQTVTRGIISGMRKFDGHQRIQTDVAISPGNSGGALIRNDGILCGIVTSAWDSRKVNDIGFAIPSPIIESALKINLQP